MARPLTRRRGFIYSAELEGLDERKLVLIVSWDAINEGMRQPICALVTSNDRERALPTYVELDVGEGGVTKPS
jgi:mRNA-degrading endonuclease toxin of MazEF toxin-antitoxin module